MSSFWNSVSKVPLLRLTLCISPLLSAPLTSFSQKYEVTGRLIGAATQSPLSRERVFLSGTTISTTTDEDGSFQFENVPAGKYDIAFLNDQELSIIPIVVNGAVATGDLKVSRDTQVPPYNGDVEDVSESKKYYNAFRNNLLGISRNNQNCLIINRDRIHLTYDKHKRTLRAYADKPIEIVNDALGYRVFFQMKVFEINYSDGTFTHLGISFFEGLVTDEKSQHRRWESRREVAYYGSLTHFVRSLLGHDLEKNHFSVFCVTPDQQVQQVPESALLKGSQRDEFFSQGDLRVIFNGQLRDRVKRPNGVYLQNFTGVPYFRLPINSFSDFWPGVSPFQISYLRFTGSPVKLYPNGVYDDVPSVWLDGYFSYRQNLSDALPSNYMPAHDLVRLTQ